MAMINIRMDLGNYSSAAIQTGEKLKQLEIEELAENKRSAQKQ